MENFKNNLDQLKLHLENVQKAAEEIPILQKMYEIGSLNYTAFSAFTSGSTHFDLNKSNLNVGLEIFKEGKGEIMSYSGSNLNLALSIMQSGATASFAEIRAAETTSEEQKKWKLEQLSHMGDFLDRWRTSDKISSDLRNLGLNEMAQEFDEMCELRAKFENDLVDHSSFGIKMRNVLEHFKGYLKKAAQLAMNQKPSRDKELSWPSMAKAIVKNPKSTVELNNFGALGHQWSRLHKDLSGLLKSFNISDKDNMISIYSEELFLIEALISCVNEKKLSAAS